MDKTADKLPNMHSTEFNGLPVVIQWPKNSIRVGEKEDGTPFKSEMKADYGYIPQTEAAGDEERLDVYIGPDRDAEYVYAVEQLNNAGEFDEWKLMLGFDSLEDAKAMYLSHNDEGWEKDHLGSIEEFPFDELVEQVGQQQDNLEEEKTAAPIQTSDVLKQAMKIYPLGDLETERYYVLTNGKILDVGNNDHFAVAEFYEEGIGDEEAIVRFMNETGAIRGGWYDGTYLIHTGNHVPTEPQLDTIMRHLGAWEDSITLRIVLETPRGSKNLDEFLRPIDVKRALLKLFGKTAHVASEYTLMEAFVKNYEHEVDFYTEVAALVQDKLDSALQDQGIKAVVSSRAKRPNRLEKKLKKRAPDKEYKTFRDIADDIVDLAGVRVALYMPADRIAVGKIIQGLFTEIREPKHFPKDRGPEDTLGYIADHYLVTLSPETLRKKEFRYADTQVEIQVASVLMHAWAEVTHDLVYKPEKGKLAPAEMKLLKDLNDIVQLGEQQLEKLQTAIEHRTSEDLRFDIAASLTKMNRRSSLAEFRQVASKIASSDFNVSQTPANKSQWSTYVKSRASSLKAEKK